MKCFIENSNVPKNTMLTKKVREIETPKPRYILFSKRNFLFLIGSGSRPCSRRRVFVTISFWISDFIVSNGKIIAQHVTPDMPPATRIDTGDSCSGVPLIRALHAHLNSSYTAKYTPDPAASRNTWYL